MSIYAAKRQSLRTNSRRNDLAGKWSMRALPATPTAHPEGSPHLPIHNFFGKANLAPSTALAAEDPGKPLPRYCVDTSTPRIPSIAAVVFLCLLVFIVMPGISRAADKTSSKQPLMPDGIAATSDSDYSGHYKAGYAVDGKVNAREQWLSEWTPGEHWLEARWKDPLTIRKAVMTWAVFGKRSASWAPRAYKLQYLKGTNYIDVSSSRQWRESVSEDVTSVLVFDPVTTTGIRILQKEGGGNIAYPDTMAVSEVRLFAEATEDDLLLKDPVSLEAPDGNLCRLGHTDPRIARTATWGGDDAPVIQDKLNDGSIKESITLKEANCGALWYRPQMVNELELVFKDVPPGMEPSVEYHDSKAWRTIACTSKTEGNTLWIRLARGVCTDRVRVKSPALKDTELCELAAYDRIQATNGHKHPREFETDELEKTLLAREGNVSFDELSSYAHGLTGRALLGCKGDMVETGVTWDGAILNRHTIGYLGFSMGDPLLPVGYNHDAVRRGLIKGYLPGTITDYLHQGLDFNETVFVDKLPDGRGEATFARIKVSNPSGQAKKTRLAIRFSRVAGGRFGVQAHGKHQLVRNDSAQVLMSINRHGRLIDGAEQMIVFDLDLPGNGVWTMDMVVPKGEVNVEETDKLTSLDFSERLEHFTKYWDNLLSESTQINVPDEQVNRLYKNLIIQQFICVDADHMAYGAYPSAYDERVYGGEESFPCLTLAYTGYFQDAQRYMLHTDVNRAMLPRKDKYEEYEDRNQQLKHGYIPWFACDCYFITGDTDWFRRVVPLLEESADWVIEARESTMELVDGKKPLHFGLLPKWARGGDLTDKAYSLRSNVLCCRSIHTLGIALVQLGEKEKGRYYLDRAAEYRETLLNVLDKVIDRTGALSFMPNMLYKTQKEILEGDSAEYYQLGCSNQFLDPEFFDPNGPETACLVDFLRKTNRTFLGLLRWRLRDQDLDALYSGGYIKSRYLQGEIDEFVLAMYAYLAFNVDRGYLVSPETEKLYTRNEHRTVKEACWPMFQSMLYESTPLPSATARFFMYFLRPALIRESGEGNFGGKSDLLLAWATPRQWLEQGKTISVKDAPTYFGKITFTIESNVDNNTISAEIHPPENMPKSIKLRLRHPARKPMKTVTVNGKPWKDFDIEQECVILRDVKDPTRVTVAYQAR